MKNTESESGKGEAGFAGATLLGGVEIRLPIGERKYWPGPETMYLTPGGEAVVEVPADMAGPLAASARRRAEAEARRLARIADGTADGLDMPRVLFAQAVLAVVPGARLVSPDRLPSVPFGTCSMMHYIDDVLAVTRPGHLFGVGCWGVPVIKDVRPPNAKLSNTSPKKDEQ